MDALPVPDADALQSSKELSLRLLARIAEEGGWIGFDRFMAAALYEPGLGYYTGGSRRFGHDGDFVTAPELSPLFGACIAGQCARWFETLGTRRIIEFGAGTGQLAAQVLNALAREGLTDVEYRIVELSAPLRQVQRHTLEALAPELMPRVGWLDRLPETIEAVVIGNELPEAVTEDVTCYPAYFGGSPIFGAYYGGEIRHSCGDETVLRGVTVEPRSMVALRCIGLLTAGGGEITTQMEGDGIAMSATMMR